MTYNINDVITSVSKNDIESLKEMLLEVDINSVNLSGKAPLHIAVMTNNIPMTKDLLERGANIDLPDKYGEVSLVMAAENGNVELVDLLIEKGIDIKTHGYSALLRASFRGQKDVITSLIKSGVNINQKNVQGRTLLHIIANIGYDHLVEHLIALGAKLNLQDSRGYTALMIAVEACNFETAKVLLENKANIGFKNKEGLNALDIAKEVGLIDLIDNVRHVTTG